MKSQLNAIKGFVEKYILLIAFGVFFCYTIMHVAARSFWIDESMVALAIVKSSLSPFQPLVVYNQVSPWGFVVLTRLMYAVFGAGDLQFRIPGILFYFTATGYFSSLLKRRFGLLVSLAISCAMLANPLLLRYSSEFKHYVFEFAFVTWLLTSYFEYKENIPRARFLYGIGLAASVIFGISIVFLVASVFAVELLRRLKNPVRALIKSRWVKYHFVYFLVFVAWYFVSIKPNLSNNLINYPHIYNVDIGPANLFNLAHWVKVLYTISTSILIPHSIILLVCILALFIMSIKKKMRPDFSILLIPVLIYLLIYALNFAGFYPILLDRHLLFVLPPVYLVYAYGLSLISLGGRQALRLAVMAAVFASALFFFADSHVRGQYFFQEIKPALKNVTASDRVFLYFSAQPGYEWYRLSLYPQLPEPVNPLVNSSSGPRIELEQLEADIMTSIGKPGAWPALALLTSTEGVDIYDRYLEKIITDAEEGLLVVSHRSAIRLRENLQSKCWLDRAVREKGALIFSVDCR